ncbi:hypothetical protein [Delftia tsuruhatensis]|uniref:hypothetical protein n=1 Tax=Delftia tsuruhatensis TaxID=180282 RepID=UPI0009BAD188|nr:hypothetical protein [Delftia tsuruhatensis]
MSTPPAHMAIQFWVVSALYASECHWLSWLYRRDSTLGRSRRYANAARARAVVIYDRVLNQEDRHD